jgi:hypothetical protein
LLEYVSATGVNLLLLVITLFTFVIKAFAFGDAALRPANAYLAAGKLDKVKWSAITGAAFVVALLPLSPLHFLNIIGDVAALVYLLDVRPALRSLGDGGAIRKSRKPGGNGPTGW